jgi:hypothetical protein
LLAGLSSYAAAQSARPGLYAFHTGPVVGGCPGLDWHITLDSHDALSGFVSWDRGQHIAKLDGSLQKDGSFKMAAQEVGGAGRSAEVQGKAAGTNIAVVISGSGTACDGQNLNIPRAADGMAGGGG